jgi:plastocyanin
MIDIVPRAPMFTDTAYDPNFVKITVCKTTLWTNNDPAFHTVTSGEVEDADPTQIFDSELTCSKTTMSNKHKTFEHTFEISDKYPYYFILHPGISRAPSLLLICFVIVLDKSKKEAW